jgi:hypothetical protein
MDLQALAAPLRDISYLTTRSRVKQQMRSRFCSAGHQGCFGLARRPPEATIMVAAKSPSTALADSMSKPGWMNGLGRRLGGIRYNTWSDPFAPRAGACGAPFAET